MRIGLDCRVLQRNEGGIRNYILGMLRGARSLAELDWRLLGLSDPALVPAGLRAKSFKLPPRLQYDALRLGLLSVERFVGEVDVFHSPAWWPPGQKAGRSVATVLDLSPFVHPEWFPRSWSFLFRWILPRVLRRADRVIAISQATKRDLVRFYGIDPSIIDVVYLAAPEQYRPISEEEARPVLARHRLSWQGYVLFVSTIEPRKNVSRLVEACERLPGVPLVIVGRPMWRSELDLQRIARSSADVRLLGYVDGSELPVLMGAARVFVYPSLYEGFGIPPLEAMQCGVPVVASSLSSVPEVVGDAALLVDPRDVHALAGAIERCLEDAALRAHLTQAGLRRAAEFNWDRCARETLGVYRRACGEP